MSADQIALFGAPEPALKVRPVAPEPAWLELAARLPAGILLGGSTWSFPGWAGLVYDGKPSEAELARHGLAAYARHPLFRAVGIDRTYYRPISVAAFAAYAAATPPGFRFLVKAHDLLTLPVFPDHPRYGAEAGRVNPRYLDAAYATAEVVGPYVEGLREKGGGLLFQFSPGHPEVPAAFAERLGRFLEALPPGPLYAVELRSPRQLTPAYAAAIKAAGACHCLNVHTGMPDLKAQVVAVDAGNAPALILRWVIKPGWRTATARTRCLPFSKLVEEDPRTRKAVAQLVVKAHKKGMPALVSLHNLAEGSSPPSIVLLAREIVDQLAGGG